MWLLGLYLWQLEQTLSLSIQLTQAFPMAMEGMAMKGQLKGVIARRGS